MNKVDLYKLPKDILVKLILTIEEETENRCRNDIENKSNHNIEQCLLCNAVRISLVNKNNEIAYTNTEVSFVQCDVCSDIFCENHIIKDGNLYLCEECSNSFNP